MKLSNLVAAMACALALTLAPMYKPFSVRAAAIAPVAEPMAGQNGDSNALLTGTWNLASTTKDGQPQPTSTLQIQQEGTQLSGTITTPKRTFKIEGSVQGDQVAFTLKAPMGHHVDYKGTIKDGSMSGTNDRGDSWTATRQ